MKLVSGQVVISISGHDKGQRFIVKDVLDDDYVTIVNGESRKLLKPKKKKLRHLQKTNCILNVFETADVSDASIRKALSAALSKEE